jgi:predicted GH43/DUF377 family glycosyl hydrolase
MTTEKAGATPSISMSADPVRRALAGAAFLALISCGRYAGFTLPPREAAATPLTITLNPSPVLKPAAPGDWDSSDVLNPSVVFHDGQYWNFYSGFDGAIWRTGLATSPDGVNWTRRGVILSPDPNTWDRGYIAANGSALWRNGEWLYWYQAGERGGVMRIGLARSHDGLRFTTSPNPVLDVGPYRSWDERAVADPYVLEIDGWLYMYYLGQDRAVRQRIGVARSQDGISWEKLRANPVVDISPPGSGAMDENGAGEPAVFLWKGLYRMLITGRDSLEHRRLAALSSSDGVHWTRQLGAIAADQAWDSAVICDPAVIADQPSGVVRFWFGGGDVARPDERIHGQIGAGAIR